MGQVRRDDETHLDRDQASYERDPRPSMGTHPLMRSDPLIAMLGILIALALMMAVFLAAYRYYKTREPREPRDR